MNTAKISHLAPPQTWQQMADEHAAMELLEARARIASLEADVRSYEEVSRAAIHALHDVTTERDRLRQSNRELRELLREYDAAPERRAA